jgi:DNA repair protein RecN (Recombination protein N)
MTDAIRWLEGAAGAAEGALDAALAALGRAYAELGEAQEGVERAIASLDFDPGELERTEERLFAIRALARKHGVLPDDLAQLREDLTAKLAALDGGARDLRALAEAREAAQAGYDAAAADLSERRRAAAARLDAAMADELGPLKMDRAVFTTEVSPADPGPDGTDSVAFTVATNPGAPPGPIARIASGGELSRFLLALKVCLTSGTTGLTLIFDEIDRGVGGATADAVGRRLAQLAADAQVLVVTHSPQVAARGAHHWRVEKEVTGEITTSRVLALDAPARIDEIARMLSGDRITEEARGAARALLGA